MLATVTTVLELAGRPLRAQEIHAAAEQLVGQEFRWMSVKAAVAAAQLALRLASGVWLTAFMSRPDDQAAKDAGRFGRTLADPAGRLR